MKFNWIEENKNKRKKHIIWLTKQPNVSNLMAMSNLHIAVAMCPSGANGVKYT